MHSPMNIIGKTQNMTSVVEYRMIPGKCLSSWGMVKRKKKSKYTKYKKTNATPSELPRLHRCSAVHNEQRIN